MIAPRQDGLMDPSLCRWKRLRKQSFIIGGGLHPILEEGEEDGGDGPDNGRVVCKRENVSGVSRTQMVFGEQ